MKKSRGRLFATPRVTAPATLSIDVIAAHVRHCGEIRGFEPMPSCQYCQGECDGGCR